MRNIASSAARNFYFLQHIGILFQNSNVELSFVQVCGAEKSCSSTSDDDYFFLFQCSVFQAKSSIFSQIASNVPDFEIDEMQKYHFSNPPLMLNFGTSFKTGILLLFPCCNRDCSGNPFLLKKRL